LRKNIHCKDFYGGLLMTLIGGAVAFQSQAYRIGSLTRMGPGFFPICLGLLLALAGLIMIATVFRNKAAPKVETPRWIPDWRGCICICLGVIAFALLAKRTGLVPATFICVLIAAFGDRTNSLRDVLLLAAGVTIGGVIVFWWGLRVLLPLFAWNFG
jgi:hypothetical protein